MGQPLPLKVNPNLMLHFFRRIRLNLLANSRFFEYLKYALGEIALVVLGILIALQINNWNSAKKNQQKELSYVSSIIEDIETDIVQSEYAIEQLNETVVGLDSLLIELSSDEIVKNSNKAYELWMNYIGFEEFRSQDRTLQLLKYSSGFEYITVKEASDAIMEYDQHVENYNFQSELISDILSNPQLFQETFDVVSLEKANDEEVKIPLLVADPLVLNRLYANRKIWKMALNGAIAYLKKVHESGKETKATLSEIYNLQGS